MIWEQEHRVTWLSRQGAKPHRFSQQDCFKHFETMVLARPRWSHAPSVWSWKQIKIWWILAIVHGLRLITFWFKPSVVQNATQFMVSLSIIEHCSARVYGHSTQSSSLKKARRQNIPDSTEPQFCKVCHAVCFLLELLHANTSAVLSKENWKFNFSATDF
jgi:hypothetical protein